MVNSHIFQRTTTQSGLGWVLKSSRLVTIVVMGANRSGVLLQETTGTTYSSLTKTGG